MIEEVGLVAHYSKVEHLDKILVNGEILIGSVCYLDDPRESDMGWVVTEGIGNTFDKDGWQNANKLRESLSIKLRLFCTAMPRKAVPDACTIETAIYGRPRMWSQYGDKFKGFCVIFDQIRLHQAIKSAIDPTDLVIGDTINYCNWLHIANSGSTIQFGDTLRPNENEILSIINNNNMLYSVYFKKGADWSEEIEYRWLVFSSNLDPLLVDIRDAIHSVVLGSKFPSEKYEDVKEYCRKLKCSCYRLAYIHPKYELVEFYKK
jgi:hypothetical protein